MEDYLIRVMAKEVGVRGLACITTNLVNDARRHHEASATGTAVLGRALTGGALMGALLKVRQRIAIKFEGTGPLQKVIVESDSYGKIRGYVGASEVELPYKNGAPDITGAIGRAGLLTVVRDLRLKELAESVIPLTNSMIDTDLTAYLIQSDQIPSSVIIGLEMGADGGANVAGGLLLQAIPPYDANIIVQLANRYQELPPLEAMLLSGKKPEEVLALIFDGIEYEILEKRPLNFQCSCSRARSEKALVSLGREEIESLLETDGEAIVDCHFCHERYVFDEIELELILEEIDAA